MANTLEGKSIAIIATDYFEESELTGPLAALADAGANVEVIAPHSGEIKGLKHVDPGEAVPVDKPLDNIDPDYYDAIVLPGGAINADNLRMEKKVREVVKDFLIKGKTVAAICHAPWILVSADCVDGKQLTSFPTLRDDIRNAGGEWVNETVVVDYNLITSRNPDDVPNFNQAIIAHLRASN
jgi:protease I